MPAKERNNLHSHMINTYGFILNINQQKGSGAPSDKANEASGNPGHAFFLFLPFRTTQKTCVWGEGTSFLLPFAEGTLLCAERYPSHNRVPAPLAFVTLSHTRDSSPECWATSLVIQNDWPVRKFVYMKISPTPDYFSNSNSLGTPATVSDLPTLKLV